MEDERATPPPGQPSPERFGRVKAPPSFRPTLNEVSTISAEACRRGYPVAPVEVSVLLRRIRMPRLPPGRVSLDLAGWALGMAPWELRRLASAGRLEILPERTGGYTVEAHDVVALAEALDVRAAKDLIRAGG